MKITQIECIPLSVPTPMRGKGTAGRLLLVKIHTDEGIIGIGDAGGVNQDAVVAYDQNLGKASHRRRSAEQKLNFVQNQRGNSFRLGHVISRCSLYH